MNCIEWEERIARHAGGDLEGPEADAVELHLADCAGCQVFWSGLREALGELRESHALEVEAAHFAAVRAGVLAEIERGRRVWRRLAWVSGVGIAAMLVLGVAMRPGALPAPPTRVAVRIPEAPLRAGTVRKRLEPATLAAPVLAKAPDRSRLPKRREPFVVKLQTSDPNIVIYWIAE